MIIDYHPFPHEDEQPYKESLNFHNKFDPKSLKQELIDAITNHLSSDGPLALMLYHKYQKMDMNSSMLKGVDYEIWNMLQDTFEMKCQSIIINSYLNPSSGKQDLFAEPFDFDTAVLDKEITGPSYNVIDAVDSCCTLKLIHFQRAEILFGRGPADKTKSFFGAVILIDREK